MTNPSPTVEQLASEVVLGMKALQTIAAALTDDDRDELHLEFDIGPITNREE